MMSRTADTPPIDPRVTRTRERVARAALELVQTRGPQGLTFSALAEASGVGRATLYRHWKSIDHLRADLLAVGQGLTSFEPSGDLVADLGAALRLVAGSIRTVEGRIGFLTMLERAQWDGESRELAHHAEEHSPVTRALEAAREDGRIAESADRHLLSALLVGPLLKRGLLDGEELTDEFIDRVVETFVSTPWVTED